MAEEMKDHVECSNCGMILDVPMNQDPEERKPCPKCGATQRRYVVGIGSAVETSAAHSIDALVSPPTVETTVSIYSPKIEAAIQRITVKPKARTLLFLEPGAGEEGAWLVEVRDDEGKLVSMAPGDTPSDCLLAVADEIEDSLS